MNTAFNNFYLIKPYAPSIDRIEFGVFKYENTIDVNAWKDNTQLLIAEVVSAESTDWNGSVSNRSYETGNFVVYDPTRVIKHFADGTKLVRDDAIACLFNVEKNEPKANKDDVVIKIERNAGLEMQPVVNGFYGTVIDVMFSQYYIDDNYKIKDIKIGDKLILVNPYRPTDTDAANAFTKISTPNGFYIVGDVDVIACKLEN